MICNRNVQVTALSSILLAFSTSAFADATLDARKAITAIYQKHATAAGHKDVEGAFSLLAPNYVSIDLHGRKSTAANERQTFKSMVSIAKSIHETVSITQFSLRNHSAVATVKEIDTILVVNPRTQENLVFIDTTISQDIWVKNKAGWLEKVSQDTSEKATLNGKPFSPQAFFPSNDS